MRTVGLDNQTAYCKPLTCPVIKVVRLWGFVGWVMTVTVSWIVFELQRALDYRDVGSWRLRTLCVQCSYPNST